MQALIEVILPVFILIGAGYVAVWRGLFADSAVDGLMVFTQKFAIPCLLFRAIWSLDLSAGFDPALLVSFYTGSVTGFTLGLLAGRFLFGRPWEDSVAIGFCCLFANSVLLGLPITERAYGESALEANFAIIALHSPICYGIGITAMEIVRARGTGGIKLVQQVLKTMLMNALVIGILLGAAFNILSLGLPAPVEAALDMMVRAALPAALFGLGGVLFRYRPDGDFRIIGFVCVVTLVVHPAITWTLGHSFGLAPQPFRSAVITAAMAPGVNAYVFANMYGCAKRVAASSVLIATGLSVFTTWLWLATLP
ncbi:AEC family transporter [Litorisediminicola beolgyonensis]|uniref:AEC family transporter n=1 Tax=Litorisediminicola beolgyonensis TaxID=1173614 RepID=A0ABW3ZK94_9RHOB